ncbi:hypothetical protein CBF_2377 [Clostridium botulinum F str. 230613]|uniref:Uncharacterized protein n=1 Tax=Clostridium botulinum (strain Langeland / NCTC 10281 / Type F) TaxID=441772 RepID=A7GFR8_CLOBL|nr:hypothetical protein CLI_2386 [Clostridium botulinum F str. Langeland]ADG00039.1 hypothetical protein CBF_2377 [Clostridium botulinum F str. 230613]
MLLKLSNLNTRCVISAIQEFYSKTKTLKVNPLEFFIL